jgi:hypothetical protein
MGQKISSNCIGDVNNIYEPTHVENIDNKNRDSNILRYNNQIFSRRPSFVRFVETVNKELKLCEMCNDGTLIQYNQCIECGKYHCGSHRNSYHNTNIY